MANFFLILLSILSLGAALPVNGTSNQTTVTNAQTSLTLLFENNLNTTDDSNHISIILLDPVTKEKGANGCAAIGEALLSSSVVKENENDIEKLLAYAGYSTPSEEGKSAFWTEDGSLSISTDGRVTCCSNENENEALRPICSNSDQTDELSISMPPNASTSVAVISGQNTYQGFRNKKSFRFLGIPYANPPSRWEYSTLYSPVGQTLQAFRYGPQCWQPGGSETIDSENCLFLNIQTPYLPREGSQEELRPVLFYIHGGGFTGGTGADPATDGGNLASREDVVTVTINYRLSTLGFLAIPGTDIRGNFGIADQITALEWTIKNIASFGGDASRITIAGQSAGAGSVRVLLGSPLAIGKFQRAVAESNLGGGITLGLSGDYGTTYSSYLTINQSYAVAGQQIFTSVGCNQSDINAQINCLKGVSAKTLVNLPTVARYVVQDGTYVNTEELDVVNRNGSTAYADVMFGNAANDGASFSTYPSSPVANETQGISEALGITITEAQRVVDSGLFPFYSTGNLTLDSFNVSQRVATDKTFRCVDQATVYAGSLSRVFRSSYYYQSDRTEGGYDPNNLGGPPITPGYPCGNPNLPYFRLHSSDIPWFFGGIACLRDSADLYSNQEVMTYFASFIRSGNPNPPADYLQVRGYGNILQAMQQAGPWEQVSSVNGPIRLFDWPSTAAPFNDIPQCAWLGYPLDYYLKGGT